MRSLSLKGGNFDTTWAEAVATASKTGFILLP